MDTPENQNVENAPKKPNYAARRLKVGMALAGLAGVAVGSGGYEVISHAVNESNEAAKTAVDTESFTLQPGDSVSQDALEAAKRLLVDGKPINPAAIPTSDIIQASQAASTAASSNHPGENFKVTLYQDGHANVMPVNSKDD